jgi:hypothetical protein
MLLMMGLLLVAATAEASDGPARLRDSGGPELVLGTYAGRYMPPNDPNLTPYWDWTVSGTGHTLYYSTNGQTPQQLNNIQLPFFSGGHPLNTDQKDMYPEDGWMLAYRDFGTPTAAPPLPYFILYNKYRGTLRLMFYNAPNLSFSYYKVDLSFRSTTATGALLTFTDEVKVTVDNYDISKKESFMGRVPQLQGWAYADFVVLGYDPNLHPDAKFHVDIWGLNESTIQLTSSQFTLNELVDNASPGAGSNLGSQLLKAYDTGHKFYKDNEALRKSYADQIAKLDMPGPDGKPQAKPWWYSPVKTLLGVGGVVFSQHASALVGFVRFFIGGKSTPTPRAPLKFSGVLNMTGTITTTLPILSDDFALATGPLAPDFNRPVQAIPWGVFNLTTKPTVVENRYQECYWNSHYSEWECSYDVWMTVKNGHIPYIFNPNVGMTLKSVKAAFARQGAAPTVFMNPAELDVYEYSYTSVPYVYLDGVVLEITMEINSPTRYSDRELVLYKVYPFIQE